MKHNQEKATALLYLYSTFIDCAVSGYVYTNYLRYSAPYLLNPKYKLYIHTYKASGYIKIYVRDGYTKVPLDKGHNWIRKYEQA